MKRVMWYFEEGDVRFFVCCSDVNTHRQQATNDQDASLMNGDNGGSADGWARLSLLDDHMDNNEYVVRYAVL